MCGVIGAVGMDSEHLVQKGMSKMLYRGIRSQVTSGYEYAVGHVRLPINGVGVEWDQPMERGYWTVGFVGEVFGFRDSGYECDASLVADTWVSLGPRGFTKFDGFWSVLAYDMRSRKLHCLVDYLAQKPMYFLSTGSAVVFSSEISPLLSVMFPVEFDEAYLSACIKWGYCPDVRRTPYVGISRVLPGEHVVADRNGVQSIQVVDPIRKIYGTPGQIKTEIELAVKSRVSNSDVPVACLLSGGLDSSLVYSLASRYGDVACYHVDNGPRDLEMAREVRSCIEPVKSECSGRPEEVLWYMQEPIDLGSVVPQIRLARAIGSSGAERVCLTGDGADELFGGYERATRYDSQASDVWFELVGYHLPRLDRVMMRHQVEVRSPFLARNVVSLATSLPWSMRRNKQVLREEFRGDLPGRIVTQEKRPLRSPEFKVDREKNSATLVEVLRNIVMEGRADA